MGVNGQVKVFMILLTNNFVCEKQLGVMGRTTFEKGVIYLRVLVVLFFLKWNLGIS